MLEINGKYKDVRVEQSYGGSFTPSLLPGEVVIAVQTVSAPIGVTRNIPAQWGTQSVCDTEMGQVLAFIIGKPNVEPPCRVETSPGGTSAD
jgi:hypothetical protein